MVVNYVKERNYFVRNEAFRRTSANPVESHQRVLDQTVELDRLLMEMFQLLMSSISVRDSELSIEQSQRATRLTQLAFIYVPLSFVTGIFGMSVQEISATGLSIWVCFVTLAIVVILTVGIFWVLIPAERRGRSPGVGLGMRIAVLCSIAALPPGLGLLLTLMWNVVGLYRLLTSQHRISTESKISLRFCHFPS